VVFVEVVVGGFVEVVVDVVVVEVISLEVAEEEVVDLDVVVVEVVDVVGLVELELAKLDIVDVVVAGGLVVDVVVVVVVDGSVFVIEVVVVDVLLTDGWAISSVGETLGKITESASPVNSKDVLLPSGSTANGSARFVLISPSWNLFSGRERPNTA
jgi:hypothetical protein